MKLLMSFPCLFALSVAVVAGEEGPAEGALVGASLGEAAAKVVVEKPVPGEVEKAEGWKPLVAEDGSNAEFSADAWALKDGVWEASKDACLWTRDSFENYLLDLEFKTAEGTNSGVILHCSDVKEWIPNSVEVQIADPFAEKWAKADSKMHGGGIFGHLAPLQQVTRKPGEWNRMVIQAKGDEITVWLNGVQTAHMDMSEWTSEKINPDGSKIPGWLSKSKATLATKGRIGLQGKHGAAQVWFRNMRIKAM